MTCGNLFKCIQCGACYGKAKVSALFIVFRNRKKIYVANLFHHKTRWRKKINNTFKNNLKECIGTVWWLIIGNVGIQFSSHKKVNLYSFNVKYE